jgi:hypothetical protein
MFVNNNTRDNPWGIVYAIAKQKINTYILSEIKTSDGLLLTDTQAIGQNLMETLLPDDKQETDSDFHKFIRNKVNTDYESNNDIEFTDTEVSDVINAQNYRKSPGLDGFTADIVFRLHSIDTDFLTNWVHLVEYHLVEWTLGRKGHLVEIHIFEFIYFGLGTLCRKL